VKLGTQHCIHDNAAVQPQTPDSIAAQLLKNFKGQHIGLLAPLVMNRKGVYTELADWARPRGYTHLRVDGNFLPTTNFPRIDRFKEHTIELPVASFKVSANEEKQLREALTKSDAGQIARASGLLDEDLDRLSGSRGSLGISLQQIDDLERNHEDRQNELKAAESENLDADMASVITELNARQVAYEAGLKLLANNSKLSIFDFI
jgi:flagellin-like hook-associated protein FlgL